MIAQNINLYRFKESDTKLPLFLSRIQAGFPSPAEEYLEDIISLDDICIVNPSATILGRIKGNSLNDVLIFEGDIVIVDKSLKPQHRDLVVCALDGEFTAKILHKENSNIKLIAANPNFKPIIINELADFRVWGVISFVIQDIKNRSHDWNY